MSLNKKGFAISWGLRKNRAGEEDFFFRYPSFPNGQGAFVVTGHVQGLGREGEIDPFGLEALHDLEVNPGGVLQIVPIGGRVVPVEDQDVQGISV